MVFNLLCVTLILISDHIYSVVCQPILYYIHVIGPFRTICWLNGIFPLIQCILLIYHIVIVILAFPLHILIDPGEPVLIIPLVPYLFVRIIVKQLIPFLPIHLSHFLLHEFLAFTES